MTLAKIGILPGLSTSEEISLGVAIVLAATLVAVIWYAWEARKQAKATGDIASATLRPVVTLWTNETSVGVNRYTLSYDNIGSGPALNVKFEREPEIGTWSETPGRVSISTREDNTGVIDLQLQEIPDSMVVRALYQDASGYWWKTELPLTKLKGKLRNGTSTITGIGKTLK